MIGTSPRKILSLFLLEGLGLGILGSTVGAALSLAAILALQTNPLTFDFGRQKDLLLSPTLDPMEIVVVSLLVIIVSTLASLQPAYKASRMEPVTAMRQV